MMRLLLLAVLALAITSFSAAARSLALVIGNDSYENVPILQKARADAAGYEALLSQRGFDVTLRADLSGRDMIYELSTFFDRIQPGDTVVFVFSGHGWSNGKENFLVPTDLRTSGSETLIARESFSIRNGVNGIIDEINKRGAGLTLAVIDACRDNPFIGQGNTRTIGISRGLSPVTAPTGTFVAFSAGAGQTALDRLSDSDTQPYSVFTRHFLSELSKPQALQSAFKRTQQLVNDEAGRIGHPQRPAYYDEVIGSACLFGNCDGVLQPAAGNAVQPKIPALPQAIAPKRDLNSEAASAWQSFKDSNSVAALELFVKQYQGTAYAALAQERIARITATAVQPVPVQPVPVPVVRPTWCPRAGTATERAICASDQLSQLDVQINSAYQYWKRTLSKADWRNFNAQQKAWLQYRNSCGSNANCLYSAYQLRLQEVAF
jgi:hypothetical protein